MAWLQLIRWKNLVIIALTQIVAWWCIIVPEHPVVLSFTNFCLVMLSTVFIAAAGYIINDYFDVKIDQINQPGRVVLGRFIARKTAIIAHTLLNISAIGMAAYVALGAGHPLWVVLQVGCTLMLWTYSTTYKRRYMAGNIIVALLTALTIISLIVYEPLMQQAALQSLRQASQRHLPSSLPVWMLGYYAYFAFTLTWVREIVKDMEDMEGDEADGCVTMPIIKGLAYATRFAVAISVAAIVPLAASAVVLWQYGYLLMGAYVLVALTLPLLAWTIYFAKGRPHVPHYAACSRYLKIIMLLGICSLLIYKIQ